VLRQNKKQPKSGVLITEYGVILPGLIIGRRVKKKNPKMPAVKQFLLQSFN